MVWLILNLAKRTGGTDAPVLEFKARRMGLESVFRVLGTSYRLGLNSAVRKTAGIVRHSG